MFDEMYLGTYFRRADVKKGFLKSLEGIYKTLHGREQLYNLDVQFSGCFLWSGEPPNAIFKYI